jgi:putative PIN family toxin of toxin-antitoxin system
MPSNDPMRVVFDTSVLVAAARSRRGASHALLLRLVDTAFVPAISVPLFVEYEAVLLRSENLLGRDPERVESFLDFLLSVSHLQEVFFAWRPALPDPDDDFILELAVAASCGYIVTHNIRDFRGSEKWGITAITPSDFLKFIETQP